MKQRKSSSGERFDGHVDREDLRAAVETAKDPPHPDVVWRHFATGCTECWSRARDLALSSRPRPESLAARPESTDPLALALGDLVDSWHAGVIKGEKHHASKWAFPLHRACIQRLAKDPFALARVYLERVDLTVTDITDLERARELTLGAVERISLPELAERDREIHHDLRGLALARLAFCHAARGEVPEARSRLREARKEQARGSGDMEIETSLTEIEIRFRLHFDPHFDSREALDQLRQLAAGEWWRSFPIKGRRASTLLHAAGIRLGLREHREAARLLKEAWRGAPRPLGRIHVEIHHRLAGVFHALGRTEKALKTFEWLQDQDVEACLPRKVRARGNWILGVALSHSASSPSGESGKEGQLEEAARHLIDARDDYQELQMWSSLARTLQDLALLYLDQNRPLAEIEEVFQPHKDSAFEQGWQQVYGRQLEQLDQLAREVNVQMPWIAGALSEVEQVLKKPN